MGCVCTYQGVIVTALLMIAWCLVDVYRRGHWRRGDVAFVAFEVAIALLYTVGLIRHLRT